MLPDTIAARRDSGTIWNMSIFARFRQRQSAPVARERLQILLSHERAMRGRDDLLAVLQDRILTAVAKHISVDRENVQVQMNRGAQVSTLEIEIEIPATCSSVLAHVPHPNARPQAAELRQGTIIPF
jgi:cell division topological specificity factor